MTTMLEKAAQAIYARKYGDHDPWDEATARMARLGMDRLSNNQAEAVADARSALLAIREANERIVQAGVWCGIDGHTVYPDPQYEAIRLAWKDMIDAILHGAAAPPEREDQEPLDRLARSFRERSVEQYEETFTPDGCQVLVVRLGPKRPS